MSKVTKILIRCPNWLGDIVMSLPLIDALKQNYPHAEIDVLVKTPFDQLFTADQRVNRVISFEKSSSLKSKLSFFSIAKKIKNHNYDLCLCLTRSFSSALPLYLANIKRRIGARRFLGSFILTDQVLINKSLHQRYQYLSFLSPLNIDAQKAHSLLSKDTTASTSSFFSKINQPYILLHPGASYGSAKTWPLESYEQLAHLLLENLPYTIVFCGDKKQQAPKLSDPRIVDLTGQTTISELIDIIAGAKLVICNDSGPMHIADGLNTPLICLFGPTNPDLTGPVSRESSVIFNKRPCGPCFKRTCPLDHSCMTGITPSYILEQAKQKLKSHGPS